MHLLPVICTIRGMEKIDLYYPSLCFPIQKANEIYRKDCARNYEIFRQWFIGQNPEYLPNDGVFIYRLRAKVSDLTQTIYIEKRLG